MSKKILVVNGPNLDRLGKREPEVYGSFSLEDLQKEMDLLATELGVTLEFFQSNSEGELVSCLNTSGEKGFSGILINPAAYSHTSIALHDAIKASGLPAIEVHISNIYQREAFRHHSMTAAACTGVVSGLGLYGYHLGLRALVRG